MSSIERLVRACEEAGWVIDSIQEGSCIVRCPKQGCVMRATVRSVTQVPKRARGADDVGFEIRDYNSLRRFLRERRRKLKLTNQEVERMAAMTDGHLLKIEGNHKTRVPQFDILKDWADALGVTLFAIPGPVPPQVLKIIGETEKKGAITKRQARFERERLRGYQP